MTHAVGSLALRACMLGTALLLWGAAELRAQDDPPEPTPAAADSVQLVFEREVFTYPPFDRRNPFRPQTGDDALGPRFEDLVLLGVVLDPDPTRSIAVLGARPPGATSGQAATRTFRLRRGQTVGNARLIDIQRRQVLMEVDDFGQRETRALDLIIQPPPVLPVLPAEPEPEAPAGPAQDTAPLDGAPQQGAARIGTPAAEATATATMDGYARGARA